MTLCIIWAKTKEVISANPDPGDALVDAPEDALDEAVFPKSFVDEFTKTFSRSGCKARMTPVCKSVEVSQLASFISAFFEEAEEEEEDES